MEYVYVFPKKIINKQSIYEFITIFWNTYCNIKNSTLYIDYKSTYWIDPNMICILGLVFEKIKENNNKIYFRNLKRSLKDLLTTFTFIKLDENITISDYPNYFQYKNFSGEDLDNFKGYLSEHFENSTLEKATINVLFNRLKEVFINVKSHGRKNPQLNLFKDKEIFCCGNFNNLEKKFMFSIVNQGHTFKDNIVRKKKIKFDHDYEYIKLAMAEGFSTKPSKDPGGLGLYLLSNFLDSIRGSLIILSGKGYFEYGFDYTDMTDFTVTFPGTVVTIIIPIEFLNTYAIQKIEETKVLTLIDVIGGVY